MTTESNVPDVRPRADLVFERTYDAPRELVFKAWTEADRMAKWWGPEGFTNPTCELDLRIGGELYIVMRGPDGTDYPMKGIFQEIVAPERLVFTSNALDANGEVALDALATVTFAEDGNKTRLTVETSAVGLLPAAVFMLQGMEAGWSQSLVRLGSFLENGG